MGHQRLTTLSLLASYLRSLKDAGIDNVKRSDKQMVSFDNRKNSQHTIEKIFKGDFKDDTAQNDLEITNADILNGYRLIRTILPQKLAEGDIDNPKLPDFLFKNIRIMRVKAPKDTDINHYFEIMNNRGEQLGKHETLKSRMMEVLDDNEKYCLNLIWEACANMEKYVQMGFAQKQRIAIFEDGLNCNEKFDRDEGQRPDEIISQGISDNKQSRIYSWMIKILFQHLTHILKTEEAPEKVKTFIFDLLHCKFLYDQYIIKREFIGGKDRRSLKHLSQDQRYKNTFEDENINRKILMLLCAFYVSSPTSSYKHWLSAL